MVDHIDKTGRSKGRKSRIINKIILEINALNNFFNVNNKNKIIKSNSNSNSNNYRKEQEKRRNRLNRVLKKLTTGKPPPPPKKNNKKITINNNEKNYVCSGVHVFSHSHDNGFYKHVYESTVV